MNDFEYTRRFFCRAMPTELDDGDNPTLIVQSYYVHEGGYALRVRLKTRSVRLDMSPDVQPLQILERYRDDFRSGSISVKALPSAARVMKPAATSTPASPAS